MQFGLQNLARLRDERSRSITAENPDGAVGAGGQAASSLGQGRKGRPSVEVPAGETVTIADIDGPGVIRHIWLTTAEETHDGGRFVLRDLVLRMYWDDEDEPSVEVPLGDFFCCGHGRRTTVNSLPIVVAPNGGLNSYFPMPFRDGARITVESQHPADVGSLYYQIDYAEVPELADDTAYFHAQWRRENPNERGQDVVILDGVEGTGHYVGTQFSWSALGENWWGEGEVKFYLDGDEEFPTICGTGTEDYVGGAWSFMQPDATTYKDVETYSTPFLGYHQYVDDEGEVPKHGMYRWHVPDPVCFEEDLRVTVQAIGVRRGYYERSDDVATTAYWYQTEPHAPFPEFPGRRDRLPR